MSPQSSQTPVREAVGDCFDPFPEPRTFPGGWDMQALIAKPQPPASHPASHPAWHTPFPKPRTIPEGWDLTDLLG